MDAAAPLWAGSENHLEQLTTAGSPRWATSCARCALWLYLWRQARLARELV